MLIVHVHVKVREGDIESFKTATLKNAQCSLKEAGVIRFDLIQKEDDPVSFLLQEVYKNRDASAKHKETDHYSEWRDTVESMMAEPRYSIKYRDIFPEEKNW
jgi:quinol monooxygenase YgiN